MKKLLILTLFFSCGEKEECSKCVTTTELTVLGKTDVLTHEEMVCGLSDDIANYKELNTHTIDTIVNGYHVKQKANTICE